MTPTRRRMDPSTLEDILLLKFNTDLWNAQLVQKVIKEEKDKTVYVLLDQHPPLPVLVVVAAVAVGQEW